MELFTLMTFLSMFLKLQAQIYNIQHYTPFDQWQKLSSNHVDHFNKQKILNTFNFIPEMNTQSSF